MNSINTVKRLAWVTLLLSCLAMSGCAALYYIDYTTAPKYPEDKSQEIKLEGLKKPVQIYLDEMGTPHLDASDEEDLMRAIGFVQGRNRFFQMDTLRRYARGRLSELVGDQRVPLGTTADLDASMRGWGFEKASREEAENLPPEVDKLVTAFVEGVNAALESYPPVEYRLLGVKPEPWTKADSFAVAYIVAWGVTHNWRQELSRVLIALHVGVERASRIYPHTAWPGQTALTTQGEPKPLLPAVVPEAAEFFPVRTELPDSAGSPGYSPGPMAGGLWQGESWFTWASNGWVIGGGRTASGLPIVANDPHLPHMVPSMMFQMHIRCDDLDVIGATVPGLPYVLMGHNRQVAWGLTSAVADAIDLFIEKTDPEHPGMVQGPEGPEPLETEEFVIRVRDGSEMREIRRNVRRSPRGPLINDLYPDVLPDGAPLLSVHAGTLDAGRSILGLRQANRATSVAELRNAMLAMATPINTVMAADRSGQIALFATGRVPTRTSHRGTFPAPAWIEAYKWGDWLGPDQMPLGTGSGKDFFAHGNSLMLDPERSEIMFQIDSAPSYRLERMSDLIKKSDRHDVESNARIHGDILLYRGRKIAPIVIEDLRGMQGMSPAEREAFELLAKWDYRAEASSVATAIFFVTYREAIIEAMMDEVGKKGVDYLLKQRYFTNAVDRWYPEADHPVWDNRKTSSRESRADVIRTAFRRAVTKLTAQLGDRPTEWRWGRLHDMELKHAFGKKAAAFNLEKIEVPGSIAAVWKAHFDLGHPEHPFRANYGPVYRMIVDLADMDHAWWVIDTGASGWPLSPHYADQFELWRQGKYATMLMNWNEIRKSAKAVLTMVSR